MTAGISLLAGLLGVLWFTSYRGRAIGTRHRTDLYQPIKTTFLLGNMLAVFSNADTLV